MTGSFFISDSHAAPVGAFTYRQSTVMPFPPLPMPHDRKSDFAVITWIAGEVAYRCFSVTGPAMKRYADKVNADFLVVEGYSGQPYALSNKFRVRQVIEQYGYEAVLFVDADALVREHCVNFFERVPRGHVAILDEESYYDEWMLAAYRREASALLLSQGYQVEYDRIPSPKNSGLYLIPASESRVLEPFDHPFPLCGRMGATVEQTWFSLMLEEHQSPLFPLQHPGDHWIWFADPEEKRTSEGMVLHFAGLTDRDEKRFARLNYYAAQEEPGRVFRVGGNKGTTAVTIPRFDKQMMLDAPAPAALKFPVVYTIDTHRYGWDVVIKALSVLANPDGVLFDGFIENTFLGNPMLKRHSQHLPYRVPWLGFIHHPPGVPDWPSIAWDRIQNLVNNELWLESLSHCLGLFALTDYLADWTAHEWDVPCEVLRYPTLVPSQVFSMDEYEAEPVKRVVNIGFWLRRFTSFSLLRADGFQKVRPMLIPDGNPERMNQIRSYMTEEIQSCPSDFNNTQPVHEVPRLAGAAYDELLSKSVVFLDLIDASGVTTIVECMVRATPILVNPLPGVVEYLGADYPLYYDSLEEATAKLLDPSVIFAAHCHINSNPMVQQLTPQAFLDALVETQGYRQALAMTSKGVPQ